MFQTLFERLNNGKRMGNAASEQSVVLAQPEAAGWGREEWADYSSYADERIFNNGDHAAAQAAAEKNAQMRAKFAAKRQTVSTADATQPWR